MRLVVLSVGISLDGYIARRDGSVDFLFMPKDYSMASFLAEVDTEIMGRRTLDAALKMGDGALPASSMKRFVFSRSRPAGERDGLEFVSSPPDELIGRLRARPGGTIWLMGGGELAREFLRADLLDEIHMGIVPVLLGEGIPLFPEGFPQRDFRLLSHASHSGGMIALKYRREYRK
jgi:dihydrofolate reductase